MTRLRNSFAGSTVQNGFTNVTIRKEKQIRIPDDILSSYLSPEQLASFKKSGAGIFSMTVYAEKPCCDPAQGCC